MASWREKLASGGVAAEVRAQGYSVLPSLLSPAEVEGIKAMLEDPDGVRKYAYRGTTKMVSFPKPGDDVLGRLARSKRLHAVAAAAIEGDDSEGLGPGDVQLHHLQAVFKEPRSPYAFAWHQDYGYHYHGGVLLPRMCTLVVAIDPCLPENGGLEMIAGSHLCGRIDHRPKDSTTRQLTADPDRVALLLQGDGRNRFVLRPLALQPGDAVVFHCLTLHRSGANASGLRRYALNITYNRRNNLPVTLPVASAQSEGQHDDDGSSLPPLPPLPYAVVEEDVAVAAGGTAFDHEAWGMPPVPRAVHEVLERFRDGEGPSAVERSAMGITGGPQGGLLFTQPTPAVRDCVEFKCKALKLALREEDVEGEKRLLVLPPPPAPAP